MHPILAWSCAAGENRITRLKNPQVQYKTTNQAHMRQERELNPGHLGGASVYQPLRYPDNLSHSGILSWNISIEIQAMC